MGLEWQREMTAGSALLFFFCIVEGLAKDICCIVSHLFHGVTLRERTKERESPPFNDKKEELGASTSLVNVASKALFYFAPIDRTPPIAHVLFSSPHAIVLQVAMRVHAQRQQRVQGLTDLTA